MTMHLIPDRLAVPLPWAASFTVDGKATARDLSYSVTVGWLAAQRPASEDGQDVFLGDNGLRMALARTRRDKAVVENKRVSRTLGAKAAGLGDPAAMPSLAITYTSAGGVRVERGGIVRDGDRQQQWKVPAAVAASMRVQEGEPAVEIPWSLLQHARQQVTLVAMLRILALVAGDYDPDRIVERHDRKLVLLMPFAEVLARFSLPEGLEPKAAMRRFLTPAAAEITEHTGYRVSITEKRVRYVRGPHAGKEGPLQGILIDIEYPVIDTPLAYPAPRQRGSAWKPKPRFHKPPKPAEPPRAKVDDYRFDVDGDYIAPDEPMPAPASPPRFSRFGRRPSESVKCDDGRSPDRKTSMQQPSEPPRRPT